MKSVILVYILLYIVYIPRQSLLLTFAMSFQTMNDDINSQKSKARDLISAAKRLRRESSSEDDPVLSDKMEDLKQAAESVTRLAAERLSLLEQVVPLAAHFHETHR